MKIDEKIQEMQSELIKVITEANSHSEEDAIRLLEEFGLDNASATKLLETFRCAEEARNAAKNIWESTMESRVENDNDIAEYQQREFETRQLFDKINAECSLLMVAKRIDPNKIDEEVLGKLYEQGIKEEQIDNPALRISLHYFIESKVRGDEAKQLKEILTNVGKKLVPLRKKMEKIEENNKSLKKSYEDLQEEYSDRVVTDEKKYQAALVQISILKKKLKRLQDRSVFQVIKDKLFGVKIKELPEATEVLPETLYQNSLEKMQIMKSEEELDLSTKKNNKQNKKTQAEYQH